MKDLLKESLLSCPIVQRGEYTYFIHPISDGVPVLDPALLRFVAMQMLKKLNLEGVDKIVVAEAMGIHIGSALSLITDIPMVIVRKREYKLPHEIALHQTTGYSKGELYLNGIYEGDKVVFIDDVISTGGTMSQILLGLKQAGAEVVDTLAVIKRGNPDIKDYKYLIEIEVDNQGVHILNTQY